MQSLRMEVPPLEGEGENNTTCYSERRKLSRSC